jgi:hypothetical protein
MSAFRIPAAINSTEVLNFSLSFHFNKFTIPAVYAVALNNGTKKETTNYVVVEDGPPKRLLRDEFLASSRFITRMEQIMRDRAHLQRIKNEYESLIYHIKGRLDHDVVFNKVIAEDERQRMIKQLETHEEWLGIADEEHATLSEFTKRLSALKEVTDKAEIRASELVKRPAAFAHLNETLVMVENVMTNVWKEQKPWLSQSHYNSMETVYNETKQFYNQKLAEQAERNETEDPVVMADDIEKKRNHLEQVFNVIDKIKKPTPTPTATPQVSKSASETPKVAPTPEPPISDGRPDRTPFDNDDL